MSKPSRRGSACCSAIRNCARAWVRLPLPACGIISMPRKWPKPSAGSTMNFWVNPSVEPGPANVNRPDKNMEIPGELLKQTSIIVCTVDRLTDLEACLKSLLPFRAAVADVIVVNNGPHLAPVEEVSRRHGAVVVNEPQRGVSRARNR